MFISLGLLLTFSIIRWSPLWMTAPLCHLLNFLINPFIKKERLRVYQNIEKIYGLPAGSHFSKMFAQQCLRHQIRCAFETIRAMQYPECLNISGFQELQEQVRHAEARGKAHILITAHLGAWELAAFYAAKAGTKTLTVLAKPSRYQAVTQMLDKLRRRRLGTPVLWTGSKTLVREMLGILRRGEPIGFVMDQKPEGRQGPIVDFMGVPTPFVSGPAAMALRVDATVIAIFVVREGSYRYRILSETLWSGVGEVELTELELTARMAAKIENIIRTYPEQWTWNYKRWRWGALNPVS